ncbi:MAG: PD-(D/E)XK nuclease family protein, partial [Firmicutes bacterium]|nr:PD-(D/E)XK nuclease family protein [Bacillota bacterium]
ENAAGYVLSLIRDEGYRMRDIKIILNDQDLRGPIVKRVFEEYGLDLFSDSGRDVLDNPIIRYVLSVLDVVLKRFDTQSVMAMLKTGLAGLTSEEIADLENYVIKYRITGSMWKKPFMRGTFEYDEEALGRINELRKQAVEPLIGFSESFKAKTYGDFIRKFYEFLKTDANLVKKIEDLENTQVEEGREDLAEETDQVWDSFLNITEQINEIMGGEAFDGEAFRELLETGLSGIKVGMLPPSKDGLIMGTMQRTRTGEVKVLVVLGANEGVLPAGKPSQGIFQEDEKELFKESGIELLKRDSITFMEEKMGIYRNLSNARDRLYISYSMSDLDGNAIKPSAIWLKVREIFPNVSEVTDCVSTRNMDLLINGERSGLRHMANSLERSTEGERISQAVREGINWYKLNDPDKLNALRRGLTFTNKADDLGRDMASRLYKKDPSRDMSLSPSRIERFSRCPFSHFVTYGLSPKERRVFEVAPREIGDLYHACLMRLTNRLSVKGLALTDPKSPWMTITDEELEALIKEFLEAELSTYRDGVFKLGNEEKYRSDRILDTCIQVAKNLVTQVRAGSILKGAFEVNFGRGQEIPPIVIQLGEEDGNATAYIEGIIDRVDYLPDSRVKIIDYKTGDEKFTINEAEKGYRLQLMLYLKAAMEDTKKPAGVFYFKIQEPAINMTGKVSEDMDPKELDDELKAAITKEFKLNGVMVNDPDVIRNIAGEFDGYSDIVQLRNGKDGITSGTRGEERLLSDEDFMKLKDKVSEVVAGKVAELMRGRIDIHPMKTSERSACTFCQYKGICRFDTTFEGNSWNIID